MKTEAPLFTREEEQVDPAFKHIILHTHKKILSNDQSCTFFCSGQTGSGKSNLMLIAMKILGQTENNRIGTTDESYSEAYGTYMNTKGSMICHDEANYSSRRSNSSRNEDTTGLLMTVRGQNLINWLNNPSLQYIDKKLVSEGLINFFIFIIKKKERYLVFSMESMFKFEQKYGNLRFNTLMEHGRKYADYEGEFGKVDKEIWDRYEAIKEKRMKQVGTEYVKKYGKKGVSAAKAAKQLGVSDKTIRKYLKEHAQDKALTDTKTPAGRYNLQEKHLKYIEKLIKQ